VVLDYSVLPVFNSKVGPDFIYTETRKTAIVGYLNYQIPVNLDYKIPVTSRLSDTRYDYQIPVTDRYSTIAFCFVKCK